MKHLANDYLTLHLSDVIHYRTDTWRDDSLQKSIQNLIWASLCLNSTPKQEMQNRATNLCIFSVLSPNLYHIF